MFVIFDSGTVLIAARGPISTPTALSANVRRVREITVGFWQDIYKGDLGRARVGLQYEYVWLDLFSGSTTPSGTFASGTGNPAPNTGLHPNNNIVFFSLRYYPFN